MNRWKILSAGILISKEPNQNLSDNIIVNTEFNNDVHIAENTDDVNGNIALSTSFTSTNINDKTFKIETTFNSFGNNNTNLEAKIDDIKNTIAQLKDHIDQAQKLQHKFQSNVNQSLNPQSTGFK